MMGSGSIWRSCGSLGMASTICGSGWPPSKAGSRSRTRRGRGRLSICNYSLRVSRLACGQPVCEGLMSGLRPASLRSALDPQVQEHPAGDKEDAADRGSDTCEGAVGILGDGEGREDIEGAAEEDDAHDKAVAGPDHPFVMDLFGEKGDKEQGEDVVELVADACFEDRYRVRADHCLQLMGGEGAEGDGKRAEDGGDGKKITVHSSSFNRSGCSFWRRMRISSSRLVCSSLTVTSACW